MKGFTRSQIILIAAGLFVVVGFAVLLIFGNRKSTAERSGVLTMWGLDSPAVMDEVTQPYIKLHPKVEIRYEQLNSLTYEQDLINALAAGRAPDIFAVHSSWLPKHADKLWPLSEAQLSIATFRGLFPTVVEQNFAPDGVIYALPLYIDTLATIYNKDSFDAAQIALPPKTWAELSAIIPKLRSVDRNGRITKAAAAIGGSPKSISRATDLLTLLMLQAGTPMVDEDFTQTRLYPEGVAALQFYADFTNGTKAFYTWDENFGYSLDSFANGNTAIIFAYSSQLPAIKEKNPFLNIGITPMLQPGQAKQSVNWADYWGVAVSTKTQQADLAADFITHLTTTPEVSRRYLELTNRPPALRTLIAQSQTNPQLGVFALQALTARSWPQIDNVAVTTSFSKAIDATINGRATADRAIQQAGEEINDLMRRRSNK